ncbi:MAG: 3-oxoacyl-[acyl-carrier-protein] synthase III C-terminal domain-containing protein [Dehalococcoidales bacterium]|nr:3-oxoacyl-[acyl-carrier-protein] synthase III C-terminal domain-containing protein [Dehalococcoidales bacterium]
MAGIASLGVYVPLWRLDLAVLGGGRGEKAVANYDEDSLTMGVAAGMNCLRDIDRSTVEGLFFATTTSPYKEKQISVLAATALDLRPEIVTADFANSLRAGTSALKAAVDTVNSGSARNVLVIAADMRLATPGSDFEGDFGDGAAAVLVSADAGKVAIKDCGSLADEFFDIWRTDQDRFVRSWEERFNIEEGYQRVLPQAVTTLLKKNSLTAKDLSKAVFNGPNARRHAEMGKKLGFAPEQVQPPTFGTVGDTGAASSLLMLAASLEKAKNGGKILLASYGSGADVFLLEAINEVPVSPTLQDYVTSKMVLKDYRKYLHWRGLVEMVTGRRRPPVPSPSVTCLWREIGQNIRLQGVKCKHCGFVQFPPQRVCFKCHTKDQFEPYRLADKKAKLFTYTEDYATPNPDPPLVLSVVEFEGGGRMWAYLADKGDRDVEIGMPLEMTFRHLFTSDGIHNYYWKSMPLRLAKE